MTVRNNITHLFVPQFVYSFPLAKPYGNVDGGIMVNVAELAGRPACLGPEGVYIKDNDDTDVSAFPTIGVIVRAEQTGLRYGADGDRAVKGTAVSVMLKGFMPEFVAGNAIAVGDRLQSDAAGKWIPTTAETTLAEIARTPVVVIAMEAAAAADALFSAVIL